MRIPTQLGNITLKSDKPHTFIACALLSIVSLSANSQEPVLDLPVQTDHVSGYFPTVADDILLRGPNNNRFLGINLDSNSGEGSDLASMTATGIYPYEDAEPNFYRRNQDFFKPLDHAFGFFTAHDALILERSQRFQQTSLTLDATPGIFTRQFNPDLAMIKAGPFFFDLLWVGAGVLFSDYNGDQAAFVDDDDDGWAGYIDLSARALFRLTDTIYLSAAANLIYLPFENELAMRFGNGRNPAIFSRLNIADVVGPWELQFYNEFKGFVGLDFFADADAPAYDRSGRYFFGFQEDSSNSFLNDRQAFFVNKVGFWASRLVFDQQWQFGINVSRSDFWRSFDFENHSKRDQISTWLGYEGSVIPFAPRFYYDLLSYDGYNSLYHRLGVELTGRLTENVHWRGMAGYAMTTGVTNENNRFIWSFALDHSITQNTRHWLELGENFFDNENVAETLTSRYIRYTLEQRFHRTFYANAFAQFADGETSSANLQIRDRFGAGVMLNYQPLDFTQIRGTAYYEKADQGTTTDDSNRWLYKVEIIQQLGYRLTGNLFYQYEENDRARRGYTEHLMGVSVRRFF